MSQGKAEIDSDEKGRTDPEKVRADFLYWAPRMLTLMFAFFLCLFALDVFNEGRSFWMTVAALLIHLVPAAIVLIVLAVAWKWEWVGTLVFALLGTAYIVRNWGRFTFSAYLLISGTLFVIAILFLAHWLRRRVVRA